MGTSLYAITNSNLTGKETSKDWDKILENLKAINLERTWDINGITRDKGEWSYYIDETYDEIAVGINYEGPFAISPTLYPHHAVLYTIYRLRLLYSNKDCNWFHDFRKELYKTITAIGGTEVIFLADHLCDKLAHYLDTYTCMNYSYDFIKQKMKEDMGAPITNYNEIGNLWKGDYGLVNEYFLDDFKDLK